ncbi:MAG TPA: hypothetical protein VI956_12165 [Nitrospirota bacterium]|nr:hypothetical protein [Nitrospirota bacterium]
MKKHTICMILLFTGIIVVLSPTFAEEKRKTSRYSGVVQEVNVGAKTLTVAKEKRSLAMLFYAANAAFTNIKGLQELKPGDKVVVEYDAREGKTIAVTVTME